MQWRWRETLRCMFNRTGRLDCRDWGFKGERAIEMSEKSEVCCEQVHTRTMLFRMNWRKRILFKWGWQPLCYWQLAYDDFCNPVDSEKFQWPSQVKIQTEDHLYTESKLPWRKKNLKTAELEPSKIPLTLSPPLMEFSGYPCFHC